MNPKDFLEIVELIQEAREIDREIIEQLSSSKKFQFARVRDDIEISS